MIRGLIFDFDGLIVETESADFQAWREIYQRNNAVLPLSEWATCLGGAPDRFDPCLYLEKQTGAKMDHKKIRQLQMRRSLELAENEPLLPGVSEYLENAEKLGLKLAIASCSPLDWIRRFLSKFNLTDKFDAVCTQEDVERLKPDPDLYHLALARLELKPAEAIVFEDSPNGVAAAKAAGIVCVAVPNQLTRQLDLSQADLVIPSLANFPLPELLSRFNYQSSIEFQRN